MHRGKEPQDLGPAVGRQPVGGSTGPWECSRGHAHWGPCSGWAGLIGQPQVPVGPGRLGHLLRGTGGWSGRTHLGSSGLGGIFMARVFNYGLESCHVRIDANAKM